MTTASASASSFVPLAERVRHLRWLRVALSAVMVVFTGIFPPLDGVAYRDILLVTGLFLGGSFLLELLWRAIDRRALALLSGMLVIDGVYLAWAAYVTGGSSSAVRHLTVLHLIAVTLLASHRTGMKLALWHSLLLFVVHHNVSSGFFDLEGARTDVVSDATFMAVFWSVAVGTALWSAVNERELRRRKIDLEALARMATALEDATVPEEVARELVECTLDNFGFGRGAVLSSGGDEVALLAQKGCRQVPATHAPPAASVLRVARDRRETMLVSHLDASEDRWLSALLGPVANIAVVPLTADGEVLGLLVVEHGLRLGSRIERRVVSALERFTSHAALALRNAVLLARIEALAVTDGLTNIANRRAFNDTLERELARAARAERPLALVLIDIDHFKALNDTHGHQVGDEVLIAFAEVLRQHCRAFETPARYGGEEFAVILPGCDGRTALGIAERLRSAVEQASLPVPITASMGVSSSPLHGSDVDTLVQAADEALYRSKGAGRNRATLASPPQVRGLWAPTG